jgi:hypothetical protein
MLKSSPTPRTNMLRLSPASPTRKTFNAKGEGICSNRRHINAEKNKQLILRANKKKPPGTLQAK